MLKIRALLSPAVVCFAVASVVTLSAQNQTLTDQHKADAVRIGTKAKGGLTGLSLADSGASWANALSATSANPGGTGSSGFLRLIRFGGRFNYAA